MQNMPIAIFRGDDTDALGYQTIVGTIRTDLDLTGCRAVFKYLSFSVEFDPIPEDKKLTVIIPASETSKFPPGLGYASLRVYDAEGKLCTFSNRIMVFVATKTPMFGNAEFEVDFNVRPELEPLKIFVGPNPDDFDEYRGFLEKVINRASAEKYGLAMLLDAIDSDLGADDGVAATPVAVKAAYAAIIKKLTDDYYTADETDDAIDSLAAYYITYTAAGAAFPTRSALLNATVVYSGGAARTPTRNDYAVVLADESHGGAEWRYIYTVAAGATSGQWDAQYPIETNDYDALANKPQINGVSLSGNKTGAALGLADETTPVVQPPSLSADLFPIVYQNQFGDTLTIESMADVVFEHPGGTYPYELYKSGFYSRICGFQENGVFAGNGGGTVATFNGRNGESFIWPTLTLSATGGSVVRSTELAEEMSKKMPANATGADIPVDATVGAQKINAALAGKVSKSGDTMTGMLTAPSLTIGARATGSVGNGSVAEGLGTVASGAFAHAEGLNTVASDRSSHSEGVATKATGSQSHAEGFHTSATNPHEHAEGSYNASHTSENRSSATLHSIGIGTSDNDRKNAVETMRDGKTFIHGIGGYDGTNPTATGVKDLATAVNDKANRAPNPTAGNLAELDAQGNPVDSGKSLDDISREIADAGFVTVIGNACHSDRQSTTTVGFWDWNKTNERILFTNRFPDYTFDAADRDFLCMMGFGLPGAWNFNPNLDDTYFVLNSASQNYATKYGQMSIPVNVVNANGRIRMTISYCMSAYNSGDTRNVNFDVKMDGSVVAQVRDPHASKTSTSQVVVFADVDSAPSHTLTISADNTTATCGVVIAGIKIDFKAADYATAAPSTDISAAGKPADAKATGDALAALRTGKQDALSAQQLANIAAVPDKANKSALPYAIAAAETGTVAVPDPDIFPITWTANIFGDIQTYTIADASGCTVQYDSSYFNYRLHDTVRDIDIMLINADGTFNSDFDEYPYMVDNIKIGSDQHTPVSNMDTMLDFALVADLADRTVNKVALQAGTSAFSLTLPTQNDGRSRDFLLLIDNTATGAVDATATVVDATLVDAAGTAIASLAAPAGKATAYRLTEAANGTASPSANPVFIVAGANTDQQIARKLDAASAFPAFSAASTYTVGDVVTHEGGLYVCSTAVETAGPWDADDWAATSIAALLSRAVPMVVVDDEIEVAGLADTRRNGNDPDFATSWGNYVPLSWCYSYALNTSQGAYGIRLNSYTEPGNTANGVTLIAESSDGKPIYSAELVRTFAAPFDGEYDLEVTIRAPHNAINLPRYYDVLVDDETTPRLAYRPATSLSADEERVTRPGAIVLARGEHRLRIRALRHNNDNINMAVRGLKITTGN